MTSNRAINNKGMLPEKSSKMVKTNNKFITCFSRILNTLYMTNSTLVSPVKVEYEWNFSISGLKMMVKSGLGKIFLKFLHALTMSFSLLNFDQKHKFSNKNNMVSAWRKDCKASFSVMINSLIDLFYLNRKLPPCRKTMQRKSCEKNRKFVNSKIVKTCDEPDHILRHFGQNTAIRQNRSRREYQSWLLFSCSWTTWDRSCIEPHLGMQKNA